MKCSRYLLVIVAAASIGSAHAATLASSGITLNSPCSALVSYISGITPTSMQNKARKHADAQTLQAWRLNVPPVIGIVPPAMTQLWVAHVLDLCIDVPRSPIRDAVARSNNFDAINLRNAVNGYPTETWAHAMAELNLDNVLRDSEYGQ